MQEVAIKHQIYVEEKWMRHELKEKDPIPGKESRRGFLRSGENCARS